jgi:hypothetical protein
MKRLIMTNGDVEDAEPHRLAGAEPAEQPGPTDADGDGIVWPTDEDDDA